MSLFVTTTAQRMGDRRLFPPQAADTQPALAVEAAQNPVKHHRPADDAEATRLLMAHEPQHGAKTLGLDALVERTRRKVLSLIRVEPAYWSRLCAAYEVSIRRRPQGACLLHIPVLGLGLHGVQDTVGSERFDRFDESEAAMEAEPFSGVAMPLNVEAVGADPVEASEGRVELLAEIFREAGAVALDEAMPGAMPFAGFMISTG